MKILRVFNNNVVLASRVRPDGQTGTAGAAGAGAAVTGPGAPVEHVVVTGRGVGFGVRQRDEVDESKVAQIFVPADGRDPDHSAEMVAYVPYETVQLVTAALEAAGAPEKLRSRLTLVTALADHITQAQLRAERGEIIQYPLKAEVASLYPEEYSLGKRLLGEINGGVDKPLPAEEATALSLHLVNAGFSTGDLSYTYQMTGVIQQMLDIVGAEWETGLRQSSISVARFITHVRYLFVRLARGEQLDHTSDAISTQIAHAFPQHDRLARKIARVVELRFDQTLTEDEIAYLTLHIARLADTERNEHD